MGIGKIDPITRKRNARWYILLLVCVGALLFVLAVIQKWPTGNDNELSKFLTAAISVFKESTIEFLSAIFSVLFSIGVARFIFGNAPENTPQGAGILRVTKSGEVTEWAKEVYKNIERAEGGEVIISDNWLCSLEKEMYHHLEKAIVKALRQGTKISIVLMHPNSPLLHRRDLVVERTRGDTWWQIETSLEKVQLIYLECLKQGAFDFGGSLNAYCADSYLSLSTYLTPNAIHLGFFGATNSAVFGPQLLIEPSSMMGREVKSYAEAARTVCCELQEVPSYGKKMMSYGTLINLALLGPNVTCPEKIKSEIEHRSSELAKMGAIPINELRDQILDSQAIDFFHILGRKGAATFLADFLNKYPEASPRRPSKNELIQAIKELSGKVAKIK